MQSVPGGLWIPLPAGFQLGPPGQTGAAAMTMDASAEKCAFIIQVPKSGTLHSFEFRQATNTNQPDNGLRISFQDLNASGNPDGTQDQFRTITTGFGAGVWLTPPGPLTNDGTNGGTKRSVTKGDYVACVVEFESFVAGDSVEISALGAPSNNPEWNHSLGWYFATFVASWTKQTDDAPCLALKYDDGSYGSFPLPVWPIKTVNTRTWNNGGSPLRRGVRFQLPMACRCAGAWARLDLDGDADLTLYNNADTVLATVNLKSVNRSGVNGGVHFTYWATAQDLAANTTYRLVVTPSSGTNMSFYDLDIEASALLAAMDGGSQWYSTWGTTGSWTDTDTNRGLMGLLIDGIESGGAGGEHAYVFAA